MAEGAQGATTIQRIEIVWRFVRSVRCDFDSNKQQVPEAGDDAQMAKHSYAHIVIHATWSTYRRLPSISDPIEWSIRDAIAAQCVRLDCGLYAFGASDDHVHVVFSLPATITLAATIKAMKGASGSVLQKRSDHAAGWSTGYFAASARADQHTALIEYVLNQREHHQLEHIEPAWEFRTLQRRPAGRTIR